MKKKAKTKKQKLKKQNTLFLKKKKLICKAYQLEKKGETRKRNYNHFAMILLLLYYEFVN